MNRRISAYWAGGLALAITLLTSLALLPTNSRAAETDGPRFEAVTAEIPVGNGVRLEVRLVGADGTAMPANATVTATRLDMGPDGMEGMTTRIALASSDQPGILAFEADVTMAGRWALTITASVDGLPAPVTGVVVFTATEKKADATPAASAAGGRRIAYYRHPMGLADTSPVPKQDEMGMDYIPVYEDEISGPVGSVRLSPEKIQRSGIRTAIVSRHAMTRTIRAFGTITADESRMAMLSAKFDGFVETLNVNATGMRVAKGQPLARVWIESADILQKEADFLSALKRGDAERAAENLRLFGIPDDAIAEMRRTGAPIRSIVLRANASGIVLDKQAVPGMRFEAGEMLFMLADLSSVWLVARIAERDLALVAEGQTATIRLSAGGAPAVGLVTFIYPTLDAATRTASVRIEIPNPDGALKVGQYADVAIQAKGGGEHPLAVPESAILDSGVRQVAFVAKDGGLFEPRDVTLGRRSDGEVEVTSGLSEGERIVVSGNFLIDAESNLRAALAGLSPAAATP
jgi:Cu(I)/Ag(I) efflux system membrane fusion protein